MLAVHYGKAPIIIDEYDTPIQEAESARWLTYDELDSVKWLPADEMVVEKLKQDSRRED